jgi:hypothetical protein
MRATDLLFPSSPLAEGHPAIPAADRLPEETGIVVPASIPKLSGTLSSMSERSWWRSRLCGVVRRRSMKERVHQRAAEGYESR